MKKALKFIAALLLVCMLMPVSVSAQGSTTIFISNRNPGVGDTFTVTVNASVAGQMTISFDPSVINIIGSTVTGQSTSNSLTVNTTSVTITFSALAAGNSGVVVSSPTLTGSSINVPVSAAGAAPAPDNTQPETPAPATPAPEESAPQPETPEAAPPEQVQNPDMPPGDFTIDGINFVISERYPDTIIPYGFVENVITINSKGYRQLTNGRIILLYLKRSDNTEGDGIFCIYDEATGALSPFMLLGSLDEYVILSMPPSLFSPALESTTLSIHEANYPVYHIRDSQSEFYYVYGMNEDLAEGWFAYDSITGRVSRADTASLALVPGPVVEETPEESSGESLDMDERVFEGLPITKGMFIGIIAFVAILLVVIIINVVLKRKNRGYEDDDDYYDEDEDDEYEYDDDAEYDTGKYPYHPDDQGKESFDEDTTALTPEDKNLVYEDEQFQVRVKELGLGEPEASEERVPEAQEKGTSDTNGPDGEDLIDDIIKKASSRKNVDLMDLDDM